MSDAVVAGVIEAGAGLGGISWSILGQTYVPVQHSAGSMAWRALLPPGTFVPPHVHPTQDEFVLVLEGVLSLDTASGSQEAGPGAVLTLPRGAWHGLFNRSAGDVRCLFWVSPTARLFELFRAIDGVGDPAEVVRLAALHEVEFLPG